MVEEKGCNRNQKVSYKVGGLTAKKGLRGLGLTWRTKAHLVCWGDRGRISFCRCGGPGHSGDLSRKKTASRNQSEAHRSARSDKNLAVELGGKKVKYEKVRLCPGSKLDVNGNKKLRDAPPWRVPRRRNLGPWFG